MSDDTTGVEDTPEDNEVIRKLRRDLKDSRAETKTAGADAVALVERGSKAAGLMPEGFKGLADIYAQEVDGELDANSAAEWLKGRGFAAPSDALEEEATSVADALEAVTDLGSAVVAAGSLTPDDSVQTQLQELKESGDYKTLEEYTEAIESILNG